MEKSNELAHRKLEDDMYDIANEVVGNVGPKVEAVFKKGVIYTSPHPLGLFGLCRESINHSEIMGIWTEWIKSYCNFKKYHLPEAAVFYESPNLIVRWLGKPAIKWNEYLIPKKLFVVSAYLAICRVDDQFLRVAQDIIPGVPSQNVKQQTTDKDTE